MYTTQEMDRLVRKAQQLRSQAIADALTSAWNGTKRLAARLTGRTQSGSLAHH